MLARFNGRAKDRMVLDQYYGAVSKANGVHSSKYENDSHGAGQAHGFQALSLGYRVCMDNVSTSPDMVPKTIN